MILSRLTLNDSRRAQQWLANAYRVHQRLAMACEGDPRTLFRVERPRQSGPLSAEVILVQSQQEPDWEAAFGDFPVLAVPAETKVYSPIFRDSGRYRFRLLANPTVCRQGARHGLLREEDQRAWLERKLGEAGSRLLGVRVTDMGTLRSWRGDGSTQCHVAVQYDGELRCESGALLVAAVTAGIGRGKGFGFGLLSVVPIPDRAAR